MYKKLVVGSALVLGGSSVALAAKGPTWDYVSASLVVAGDLKTGSFKDDLEGYRFSASKSINDKIFFRVAADGYDVDSGGSKVDVGFQQWGVGVHFPLSGGVPLDPWIALTHNRYTLGPALGTGFGADIGVRSQITKALELSFSYKISTELDFGGGDEGDFSGYELSAAYAITPAASLIATLGDYELDPDGGADAKHDAVVSIGVRFGF